jgi:hypothetical protein
MIPIQMAVDNAVGFARKVLESTRTGEMLLEEVDTSTVDDREVWLITLSIPRPKPSTPSLSALSSFASLQSDRQYKTFTVDGETGDVLSMKIRQLSGAT